MDTSFAITRNPKAATRGPYPFDSILNLARSRDARGSMLRCPHYRATPLRSLDVVARQAGVSRVWYKDESSRFGLGSFKALGGAYAVALLLAEKVSAQLGRPVSIEDLARGVHSKITREITVVCASDGNHGRSVAAGAQVFGCRCAIYLHAGVSMGRETAITERGAQVFRTKGNYDDSVREATEAAAAHGWEVISDTSWPGYQKIPATVMQGYTVMLLEIFEQLAQAGEGPPTHVFLQGGVGGLAAAVVAHCWEHLGPEAAPVFVIAEPERADCLYQSALAGRRTPSKGDLETVMAGLSCGESSEIAWTILEAGAEFFMTIPDEAAVECMRLLARGAEPVVAGESATAGLAALLALNPQAAQQMRLNKDSRVLLFGTEGATDPELYRRLTGDSRV